MKSLLRRWWHRLLGRYSFRVIYFPDGPGVAGISQKRPYRRAAKEARMFGGQVVFDPSGAIGRVEIAGPASNWSTPDDH